MALKISFNKTQRYRTFNYAPRYWNKEKDDLQSRIRNAEIEAGYVREEDKDKPYVPNIRGQFRRNLSTEGRTKDAGYNKNIKYIIMLVTIVAIFFAMTKMTEIFNLLFTTLYK